MLDEMPALLRLPSQGPLHKHLACSSNSRQAALQTTTPTNTKASFLRHGYMRILASCASRTIRSAAEQSSAAMHTRPRHSSPATTATAAAGGKESVVVIVGATGTGKSKLSIDIATRFPSEIVNADKIQVYSGLDITTNKMPVPEREGVPHHLLGDVDPSAGELTPAGFRSLAASRIFSIHSRRRLPIVAGGSNSFIHALLADRYDAGDDPFAGPLARKETRLRYRCCFLWVDVSPAVLNEYLDRRVDEMLEAGMFEELAEHYDPGRRRRRGYKGLERAIGVPEFDGYFERHSPEGKWSGEGRAAYEAAMEEIKRNTRRLAERQVEKIKRLAAGMGWGLRRVDATAAVRLRIDRRRPEAVAEAWERDVMEPSLAAVKGFVEEEEEEMELAFL